MQSFLGFANSYREFIPWNVKLVAPLHTITGAAGLQRNQESTLRGDHSRAARLGRGICNGH